MAATLEELKVTLDGIESAMQSLLSNITIGGASVIVTDLSQISQALGLVVAGEFRTGTGTPGSGFNGVRMRWPAMTYGSSTWNIAGVANDVLQFGLSATNGKAYAGAGAVILDSGGVSILSHTSGAYLGPNSISFLDGADPTSIFGYISASRPSLEAYMDVSFGEDAYAAGLNFDHYMRIQTSSYEANRSRTSLTSYSFGNGGPPDIFSQLMIEADGNAGLSLITFNSTDVAGLTGWLLYDGTWTYVSAGSFTVLGDQTGKLFWGVKVWVIQTTSKWFYVTASSYASGTGLTTVTITGWGVYSLSNAAIVSPRYSYEYLPQGWTFKVPTVLPIHGGFYCDDATIAVACTNANTYYQVASGMTTQACNIMTFVASYGVRIVEPGIYLVTWSMTVSCSANLQDVEGAVLAGASGTTAQVQTANSEKTQTAGDLLAIGGTGLVTCAAADILALGVANESGAGTTVTVNMANLTAIRVGG